MYRRIFTPPFLQILTSNPNNHVRQQKKSWFAATDISERPGNDRSENDLARHCKKGSTTPNKGGGFMDLIAELDLRSLPMQSKLPSSEGFINRVYSEVISSIR